MIRPEVLDALLAHGATAEMIVAAVKADGLEEVARRQLKRANDAARQRKSRASRDVTVTECDGSPYEDTSTPSVSPTDASHLPVKRGSNPDHFPRPSFADPKHWRDLLANRKRKRLPNTETAYADMMADIQRIADDEWPPGKLVQHAAAKGWGGIYDPRAREQANGNKPQQGLRGSRPDPAVDLLRQARAELAAEGAEQNQIPDSGTRPALPPYLTG